jgi:hypothetical protein
MSLIPFSFWKNKISDGPIVTDQLAMSLDAGNVSSYSGSGSTWFDLSGNSRDMTLFNGVGYSSLNQGSLTFDGIDDYAKITNCGVQTFVNPPHSLEIWANFDYLGPTRWWLAVLGAYGGGGSQHWIGTSATATFFGKWGVPASQLAPTISAIGNWNQIILTFDGTTLRGYKNGSLFQSAASTQAYVSPELTLGLRIGAEKNFEGKISITRVYTKRLSDAEVLQNFDAIKYRYGL